MNPWSIWEDVPLDITRDRPLAELQEALDLQDTLIEILQESGHSRSYIEAGITNYENHKRTLESWIASKQAPRPPVTAMNGQSEYSVANVPSRNHSLVRPYQETRQGHKSDHRKHARQNTLTDASPARHKIPRLDENSPISTPPGESDSSDEDEKIFERERQRKRMMDTQRMLEERYAKEKADEELAKKLSEEGQSPETALLSRASSSGYMSQAMIGTNGRYHRRSVSPPASRNASATQTQAAPTWSFQGQPPPSSPRSDSRSNPIGAGQAVTGERGGRLSVYEPSPVSNPITLPPISSIHAPSQHNGWQSSGITFSHRPSNGDVVRSYQPGASDYSVPGAYPSSTSYSSAATSVPRPGQSMYGTTLGVPSPRISDSSSLSQPHYDWMSSAIDRTSSIYDTLYSFDGPSRPLYGGYIDSDEESVIPSYARRSVYDHGYADPKQTREELEKLLANIRPDEELEEEARLETPNAMSVQLMKHQRLGLTWLKQQEEGTNKGSILADDMGLGKTIQAIGLIISRPSSNRAVKTTLIVCPVALMRQWERELNDKVKPGHKLSVFIYHGQKRADYAKLATHDVVITTIGKVGSELKKRDDLDVKIRKNPQYVETRKDELSILGKKCKFWRVIIDEAQCIKNHNTRGAKAAYLIQAKHRLCMTGTPMMNNVRELWSLIHFLKIQPYNEWNKFANDINTPLSKQNGLDKIRDRAMKCLQALLKAILLRRTKKSLIDGQPILKDLPSRSTEVVHAVFDEAQQSFYSALEGRSRITANRYLKKGTTLKNYAVILVLLLRLRQACDHPNLIREYDTIEGSELTTDAMEDLAKQLADDKVRMIKEANDAFECPICMDGTENPTIFFPCGHDVCAECFARLTDPSQAPTGDDEVFKARCPECRADVHPAKVLSYNIFKKVHLPEKYMDGMLGTVEENNRISDESDSSEEESDDDDDDDTRSNGDLRDFIVNDDDETVSETESEAGDEETADAEAVNSDKNAPFVPKSKALPIRSKGKGKSKARNQKKPLRKSKAGHDAIENEPEGSARGHKSTKKKQTLADLKKASLRNAAARNKYIKRLRKDFRSSAKIDKTMELVNEITEKDASEKIIIFSQFTSFLDLLEIPMVDSGFGYRRYDGSMKPSERDEAVQDFYKHGNIKVMLISLKAGNAGLNLTCASHVIILDPFWNPFIEEQAIDRAHRIGQTREVKVHRILVRETVEDRIVDLQEKKRQLVNEALDENASRDMGRLGVREFRYLFGLDNELQND